MKADPRHQQLLLRLQEADSRLTRIAHALKNLPQERAVAEAQAAVDALARDLVEVTGRVEDLRVEVKRIESDVAVVEQRLARDADLLQHSSSPKDIEGIEAEVASLKRRRSDLEDLELEAMERLESTEAELAEVTRRRDDEAQRIAALIAERDAERARLDGERSDAEAERMAIAQGVPQELLALYEKQRARYGIGAAAVVGGVNLGSNLTLSPSDLAAVQRADPEDVIIDSDSGAILVR